MTYPHVTTANHRPAPTLAMKAGGIARRAWQAYWDWRARQATIEILRALDTRTLRDIGLSRSEIELGGPRQAWRAPALLRGGLARPAGGVSPHGRGKMIRRGAHSRRNRQLAQVVGQGGMPRRSGL